MSAAQWQSYFGLFDEFAYYLYKLYFQASSEFSFIIDVHDF